MMYAKPSYCGMAFVNGSKYPLFILKMVKKPEILEAMFADYEGKEFERLPVSFMFHKRASRLDIIMAFPAKKTIILELDLNQQEVQHSVLGLLISRKFILSKDEVGHQAITMNVADGITKFKRKWEKELQPFLLDKWVKKHFKEHENPELNTVTEEQLDVLKTQMPELWAEILEIYEKDWR